MSNIDQINAYFGNEMTGSEKLEFEKNLQKDAALKKEFDFHKELIQAIKERRKAQLKAMLDKVPVSGGHTGYRFGKTASVIATVGLAVMGIYFLWPETPEKNLQTKEEISLIKPEEKSIPEAEQPEVEKEQTLRKEGSVTADEEKIDKPANEPAPEEKAQQPEPEEAPKTPDINKPDLVPLFDTQEESIDSLKAPGNNLTAKAYDEGSLLNVEVENDNKRYDFHYQFKNGKLFLFGAFDQGLYEILEINEHEGKTLFLYYKNKFYHLNSDATKVTPLEPVQKKSLIKRLESSRG